MKHPTIYHDIFHSTSRFRKMLSAPFIYWVIVPFVFLDISMEIFHQVAFRIYKLPRVKRSDYIFIDGQKLDGLKFAQKINCMYCGYANGLLAYGVKIASETEKYWCAVRHENPKSIEAMPHHESFLPRADFE